MNRLFDDSVQTLRSELVEILTNLEVLWVVGPLHIEFEST